MILPTKTIKPVDSLFCISSYIVDALEDKALSVDEIAEKLDKSYPKKITIEVVLLCLNYLFIIGKLEAHNETVNITF